MISDLGVHISHSDRVGVAFEMLLVWVSLIGGFVLLVAGGELLVRGSVNAATRFGVSPLVIGLTLVGFGTSTPELVTSVQAALIGAPGIAYGNIVGSNIANLLLIGGLSAMIYPIAVSSGALRRDGFVMLVAAVAFAAIAWLWQMDRMAGAVFVAGLAGYIWLAFRQEKAVGDDGTVAVAPISGSLVWPILTAVGGIVLVVLGGRLLVDGAVKIATDLGVSDTVIGLTVVAVGTSMPELVTSVVAAIKRQTEVAFGNIIGSNIYNILGIGGVTALIAPGPVPQTIVAFDNLIMIAVSAVFVWFAFTQLRITRREGGVLLAAYFGYLIVLWP